MQHKAPLKAGALSHEDSAILPFTNRRQPPFLGVRSQDFALKVMGLPILEKPEIVERECWGEEQDPEATGSLDKGPRMLLGKPIRTNRRPEIKPCFYHK